MDDDERRPAFRHGPTVEQGSKHVRDQLGDVVTYVADTGGSVILTDDGAPAGTIVHRDVLTQAGLDIAAEWGVRAARAEWGTVRARAAESGPQGITYRGSLAGVLVDQPLAAALANGLPVLAFDELELVPGGTALADGEPVAPGSYALRDGSVLHIHPPTTAEEPNTTSRRACAHPPVPPRDEETP